jgi:hypothetical protein
MIFQSSPPAAGPMSGHLWCQVVKGLPIVRGRLGALLLITRSAAHSADPSLGDGTQNGKRGIRFVTYEQLTKVEK